MFKAPRRLGRGITKKTWRSSRSRKGARTDAEEEAKCGRPSGAADDDLMTGKQNRALQELNKRFNELVADERKVIVKDESTDYSTAGGRV